MTNSEDLIKLKKTKFSFKDTLLFLAMEYCQRTNTNNQNILPVNKWELSERFLGNLISNFNKISERLEKIAKGESLDFQAQQYFLDLMEQFASGNFSVASTVKNKFWEIQNKANQSLKPDDFIDYHDSLKSSQKASTRTTKQKLETSFFDIQNFVRANIEQANYLISKELVHQNYPNEFFQTDFEIVQKDGKYFIKQILRHSLSFDVKYENLCNPEDLIDVYFYSFWIPALNIWFYDLLKMNRDRLNLYNFTRDELIWSCLQNLHKINFLLPKESFMAIEGESQQQASSLQTKKNIKPNKNAYPIIFNWIVEILLPDDKDQQSEEFINKEVLRLKSYRDKILEEIESEECSSDFKEIQSLEQQDFRDIVENRKSLHFNLAAFREKWNEKGINKSTAIKYFQNYQSAKPSFKKIYKVLDEKQIYFWITLITVILTELPLFTKLTDNSFFYWILQNPNMGSKLKMHLLNLEMRKYCHRTLTDVQKNLLRKLEESELMNDVRQILEIVTENSQQPSVENDLALNEKSKRTPSQNLQEQDLRPVCKVRVSDSLTSKTISRLQASPLQSIDQKETFSFKNQIDRKSCRFYLAIAGLRLRVQFIKELIEMGYRFHKERLRSLSLD